MENDKIIDFSLNANYSIDPVFALLQMTRDVREDIETAAIRQRRLFRELEDSGFVEHSGIEALATQMAEAKEALERNEELINAIRKRLLELANSPKVVAAEATADEIIAELIGSFPQGL